MLAIFFKLLNPLFQKAPHKKARSKGQVIIEYVLLLVVSAAMAMVFLKFISINDPDCATQKDKPNCIFSYYWYHLLKTIGEDIST